MMEIMIEHIFTIAEALGLKIAFIFPFPINRLLSICTAMQNEKSLQSTSYLLILVMHT